MQPLGMNCSRMSCGLAAAATPWQEEMEGKELVRELLELTNQESIRKTISRMVSISIKRYRTNSSEDLGSCRLAGTQSLELVDFLFKCNLEMRPIVWMDENLKVCILEVNGEYDVAFLDRFQDQRHHLHGELGEGDIPAQT